MNLKKNFIFLGLYFLLTHQVIASTFRNVKVQLMPKLNSVSMIFTAEKSDYVVFNNGVIVADVLQGENIELRVFGTDSIELKQRMVPIGIFGSVKLVSIDSLAFFSIQSLSPSTKKYLYDDALIVNNVNGLFQWINDLEMDDYIAGVVEAEVGHINVEELFKVQAIISRTYAIRFIGKNSMMGFDFVDDVYDQAFKGRNKYNRMVRNAVPQTTGLYLVDTLGMPISAAFYSNSGGYTSNSEDYWNGKPDPNLRARVDSFSIGMPNYEWTKKISKLSWRTYMASKGAGDGDCLFTSPVRATYVYCNGTKISTRTIREDLKLKSNFFSVYEDGDFVVIKGKGFGHGIGLSQEGAAKMAKLGYTYKEIIDYYYTNVRVVKYSF